MHQRENVLLGHVFALRGILSHKRISRRVSKEKMNGSKTYGKYIIENLQNRLATIACGLLI